MTLEELENSLPNGLHDSLLRSLVIDYSGASALLVVDIDIQEDESAAPVYRRAQITLSGLFFVAIEPPGQIDDHWPPDGLAIDAGPGSRSRVPSPPSGVFVHWIYVIAWNSFVHVAARNATLAWG